MAMTSAVEQAAGLASDRGRNIIDIQILSGTTLTLGAGDTLDTALVNGGILNIKEGGVATNVALASSAKVMEALVLESLPGIVCVSSGGIIRNTLVDNGYLEILAGGEAYDTEIAHGTVSGHGFLSGVKISSGAHLNGGTASLWKNIVINGGEIYISYPGSATQVTVNSAGYFYFRYGAKLSDTTINSGGSGQIYYTGTASNLTINNRGFCEFSEEGNVENLTVRYGGRTTFFAKNTIKGTVQIAGTVSATEYDNNFNGVHAEEATFRFDVNDCRPGNAALLSNYRNLIGGTYQIQVRQKQNPGTYTLIYDGFDFNQSVELLDTTGKSLGSFTWSNPVLHGDYADFKLNLNATGQVELIVASTYDGKEDIYAPTIGTRMYSWVLHNSEAILYWEYAQDNVAVDHYEIRYASQSDYSDAATLSVTPAEAAFGGLGGNVNITTLTGLGAGNWYWEVTAVDAAGNRGTTLTGGNLIVPEIAEKNYTEIETGKTYDKNVTAKAGTVIRNGTLQGSVKLTVADGGRAESVDFGPDGHGQVNSGGVIYGAIVSAYGDYWDGYGLNVAAGGAAFNTTLRDKALAYVYGYASNTLVDNSDMIVYGSALAATLQNAGFQQVNGVAKETVIDKAGSQYVSGIAINTTVLSGGTQFLWKSGAGILNTFVHSGGTLAVLAKGTLAGEIRLGGTLSAGYALDASNATVIYDLSKRQAQDEAIITDLSKIQNGTYRVYVDSKQTSGAYKLAADASAFTGSVTVVGSDGVFGEVALGKTLDSGSSRFTLVNNGGTLLLDVKMTAPDTVAPIITVTPGTAEPTRSLTLAAATDDGSPLYYSTDQKNWTEYAGAITVSANGTWFFKATDDAGNTGTAQYTVANIDRVAPVVTLTGDTVGSVKSATLTAAVDDGSPLYYSTDQKNWTRYTGTITVKSNGSWFFKATDAAGNTGTAQITFANITTGKTDPGKTGPGKTDPGKTGPGKTEPGKTGPGKTGPGTQDIGEVGVGKSVSGTIGGTGSTVTGKLTVTTPGKYTLAGTFGNISGTVAILDNSGRKVASGTIKNGVLLFNKGQDTLLMQGSYSVVLTNTGKTATVFQYSMKVQPSLLFTKGSNTDDSILAAVSLGAVTQPTALVADGWVGLGDSLDYVRFSLNSAARLVLDLTAADATRFTVFDAKMKPVVKTNLKGGANNAFSTKPKLLEKGVYYLAVQSVNAKKGGSSDYTVKVADQTVFFTKSDNSDDNPVHAVSLGTVTAPGKLVSDWIGYGDVLDYRTFTLQTGAKLNFTVEASDAVKFSVLQNVGGKLKTLVKSSVKAGIPLTTKDMLAAAGTCYLVIQSATAKKGGSADYTVSLAGTSVFFPKGDNSNDSLAQAAAQNARAVGTVLSGWVGYGDAADYMRLQTRQEGRLSFTPDAETLEAFNTRKLKISCFDSTGKKIAVVRKGALLTTKKPVAAGICYLGVSCANVKKYNTSYHLATELLAG